jgi:hypothetical protein
VNAFSVRVLNTPVDTEGVVDQDDKVLTNVLNVHVSGASERSQKTFTNKSVAMSLTGTMERGMQYARFYGQLLPFVLWIDVDPSTTLKTTVGLEKGGANPYSRNTHIAEAHDEYIPLTVSFIDPKTIRSIRPMLITGDVVVVGDEWRRPYPREYWATDPTRVYKNSYLMKQARHLAHRADVPDQDDNEPEPRNESTFSVERIEGIRTRNGKREYLVKWEGYPSSENTWEPAESFASKEALKRWVQAFESKSKTPPTDDDAENVAPNPATKVKVDPTDPPRRTGRTRKPPPPRTFETFVQEHAGRHP